ncbi:MAG TPA: polyprenyl synthetase family protein [Planctomycetes bacterium]|nr:polyprenyl synthetase family protein [Planctomycetota bacterium]
MKLTQIYRPIEKELQSVERALFSAFSESKYASVLELGEYILKSPGKRIRPALVILSAKAALSDKAEVFQFEKLIRVAAAVELIHIASLIHDDVIDKADIRHNRPTINAGWRDDVSVIFGDYVYSKAIELIGECSDPDLILCISEAIKTMSEGELVQVCQRGDVGLSKDGYLEMVGKKTASFFAACCRLGTIVAEKNSQVQEALREYGMNYGIAFQIIDDCRDIVGEENELGKHPGQDVMMREVTLPLMVLLDTCEQAERADLVKMLESGTGQVDCGRIRRSFLNSTAAHKTRETALHYVGCAKRHLSFLDDSEYKLSLNSLADCVIQELPIAAKAEKKTSERIRTHAEF